MAVADILPFVFPQFFDDNGELLALGFLEFYESGGVIPQNVYSDYARSSSLGHIITLNAAGRPPTSVYLGPLSYTVYLKAASGLLIASADNIYDTTLLSALSVQPNTQTSSSTVIVDDFALTGTTSATQVVRLTNASDLFITGFAGLGVGGQRLIVISAGAGNVYLTDQGLTSTVANRMINLQSTTSCLLMAGVGTAEYVYDSTTHRWRQVSHEQGGYFSYVVLWTASVNPAKGDGTLTGRFIVRGRIVTVNIVLSYGTTTTGGTGDWVFTLPITAADTQSMTSASCLILDNGTGFFHMSPRLKTTTTFDLVLTDGTLTFAKAATPMTWANADYALISFSYLIV